MPSKRPISCGIGEKPVKTPFVLVFAVVAVTILTALMACGQTADPAAAPSEGVAPAAGPSEAAKPLSIQYELRGLPPIKPRRPKDADTLPESVRMLTPTYHKAYRLLPDGPWARKYIALRRGDRIGGLGRA